MQNFQSEQQTQTLACLERTAPLPASIRPQLAVQAATPPTGAGWLHEVKFDGFRTLAFVELGRVRLVTRGGHDWTHRYASVARALRELPCRAAVLDGEMTAPGPDGHTRLDAMQKALSEGNDGALRYYAFDLLHLDGQDMSSQPLSARKAALEACVARARSDHVALSRTSSDGVELFSRVCDLGLEGIVSKREDSPYVQSRSASWMKVKRGETGAFRVAGFLSNRQGQVSSAILAELRDGAVSYSCRAIVSADRRALYDCLTRRERPHPAIAGAPRIAGARWIAPELTADVYFHGRNARGTPRAPVMRGLLEPA